MKILIIGGTRNMGHFLTLRLLAEGHNVTILNRGLTRDDLPEEIERLRADRVNPDEMRVALAGREFDAVVDMVLYQPGEAETIAQLLDGRVGHYIFIGTGQVYLVRQDLSAPIKESDYDGPLIASPEPNTYDYEEWSYGMQKRAVEDALIDAWERSAFPYTSLRLPMVNSQRDPFNRLYAYVLRIKDGGPILVPDTPRRPLRHVYVDDVIDVLAQLIVEQQGIGQAYNISQDETVPLEDFLDILGSMIGKPAQVVHLERDLLKANGFLPDCSPFSDLWMSELDNTRSKRELGIEYTPLRSYLEKLVAYFNDKPPRNPVGYRRRRAEKNLVQYGQFT